MEKKFKEFKPTSWSINNKTSIYVLTVFISIFGLIGYISIPKEQFPEIVIPTILVNSVYFGTSPGDMENLVTRPIEKNLKSISGVKTISSNSIQDFSSIVVEFQTGIDVSEAKQKVKDAVDKTKQDLPNDEKFMEPSIMEIDFSEIPIMYINIAGNYNLDKLKKYAEQVQDRIEGLKEITRVDIVGALDREIQVNVDMYKMQAYSLTFYDIEQMIKAENVTISGGSIEMQEMKRSIRVVGEFKNIETLKNLVISTSSGAQVFLKDIAEIKDSFAEQESFARLDGQNVITLNVIKKSGQNLLDASDQIKNILDDLKNKKFSKDLKVEITGDQSKFTRTTLFDLNNTIIIGFMLVTIVLMFFMGLTNALFVGLSVPLSMALAYIAMPGIGFTLNMLVMFSFIFALGIVVDDAIVVIENTHRIFKKSNMDISTSAKFAAGEVFLPILSGTLTTLAPFFPLAFWPGVIGTFMYFIPVTIIITLFASLLVAYIINPVFAVSFMKHTNEEIKPSSKKHIFTVTSIITGLGVIFHSFGYHAFANLVLFIAFSYAGHNMIGYKILLHFQHYIIPKTLDRYERLLNWILQKRRPQTLILYLVGLFFFTLILMAIVKPKVILFPDGEPNEIFTYIKLPVGADVKVTDSIAKEVESRIWGVLGENNKIVESVITNVALGASPSLFDSGIKTSNRAKVTVNFKEFSQRDGESTNQYMEKIRGVVQDIPGTEISVEKAAEGPPTGKPINIEVSSDDLDELIVTVDDLINYLNSLGIPGAEKFVTDYESTKPEVVINIDRIRANKEGITTGQVGMELRTAIFGNEASKYKEGEDQYPIQVRYSEEQRKNIDQLLNLKITYRDMNTGILRQIPLSSVASVTYVNTSGGITRKDVKRLITVYSNVITGYNANEIIAQVKQSLPSFDKSESIDINITGEQEDQEETMGFLGRAMLISLCLILFILITQFNSIGKAAIILSEVLFSIIGVLLGYMIFGMDISIIMTGMGLVALAGIVVRNGILLVEFTDLLKERGSKTRDAIIQAGKTRITPVMLTATATILGLVPLAIGFNIDFIGLFESFSPKIHFGGDNVAFFGPISWSIIFGLSFATFLTLILIPAMYYVMYANNIKFKRKIHKFKYKSLGDDLI